MKKYKCRECGYNELVIDGTGYYDDTIEVHCENCGESYELEPDGLGEGGIEFVDAQMLDTDNNSIDNYPPILKPKETPNKIVLIEYAPIDNGMVICPHCGETNYKVDSNAGMHETIIANCSCTQCKSKFQIKYRALSVEKLEVKE